MRFTTHPSITDADYLKTTIIVAILIVKSFASFSQTPPPLPEFITQKYSIEQLKSDFDLMRRALQDGHPGIYRYTPKDSIRLIFDQVYRSIDHEMTEKEFRLAITPAIDKIRCGHTDIYPAKKILKYNKKHKPKLIPLDVVVAENRLWVLANKSADSTVRKGDEILSIEGKSIQQILPEIWGQVSTDGYNRTYKYSVATRNFLGMYRFLYGEKPSYQITIRDTTSRERILTIAEKKVEKGQKIPIPTQTPTIPPKPVPSKPIPQSKPKKSTTRRTLNYPSVDSTVAILDINTFRDRSYKRFYRQTFKDFTTKPHIKNLIIDLRNNGGGLSVASQTMLGYVLDSTFQYYKSATSWVRKPWFNRHLNTKFGRFVMRNLFTHRISGDTSAHRWSGKVFSPQKKNHFNGQVYVLINGSTFSAASIFAAVAQAQKRVTIIGRETGGGQHGCNANFMPHLILPQTKIQIRYPLFRIYTDVPGPDVGRGVFPDYPIEYNIADALSNKDLDVLKAYSLIKQKRESER